MGHHVCVDYYIEDFDDDELLRECERRHLVSFGAVERRRKGKEVEIALPPIADIITSPEDFDTAVTELKSRRFSEALIYLERAMPCLWGITRILSSLPLPEGIS